MRPIAQRRFGLAGTFALVAFLAACGAPEAASQRSERSDTATATVTAAVTAIATMTEIVFDPPASATLASPTLTPTVANEPTPTPGAWTLVYPRLDALQPTQA